jgi:hypothetical protein
MRSKQIKSPADIQAFQEQYNQSHGTGWSVDLKNADTRRAFAAAMSGKQFNIETPRPNISDVRGGSNTEGQDTINAAARGVPDVLSSGLLDKGVAAADTLFKGGPMDYNLARQYAITDYDQQNHPLARLGGQVLGGALIPMGEMSSIPQIAGKSAAMGAAYNAGSSRSLSDVPQNALLGGAAGRGCRRCAWGRGKAIGGLKKRPKRFRRWSIRRREQLNQPLEAMTPGQRVVKAEEYGINLPADAAGGRTAAVLGKGLDIMPGSAGVMEDARRATESQVAAASDVVASRFGNSRTMNEAGAELQRGANERIDRGKSVIGKAYNAIPISDKAPASTSNAVADAQNSRAASRAIPSLRLRKAEGSQSSPGLPRTPSRRAENCRGRPQGLPHAVIGEKIGDMRFGEGHSTSDLRALYAGLSEDMRATARQMGPRALPRVRARQQRSTARTSKLIEALTRILGKDGNSQARESRGSGPGDDQGRQVHGRPPTLAQIKSATVKSGAWNEIAATLIRLGGQPANSAGRDFNPQTFVNWYADMAEPARAMLFGKSDLRQALDGFVAVNQRLQKVNALRNTSNTAGTMMAGGTMATMAAAMTNPMLGVKMLGVMAGNYGMAKAWTNPQFVRLITGYSKAVAAGNQQAVKSQIGRISKLATTNPELREPPRFRRRSAEPEPALKT